MSILFNLIGAVFVLFYFPYVIVKGKWHKDFPMRLGQFAPNLQKRLSGEGNIWVHAVSVGEVLAVAKLIQSLKTFLPSSNIVLSTVTTAGFELAQKILGSTDTAIYAPVDFSWVVRRYINLIRPKIYVVVETEWWPNLFFGLHQKDIPIVLVNGRISDRAFLGYRWVRPIAQKALSCVSVFCMQSKRDAQRVIALGAPAQNVHVTGNIKFDDLPSQEKLTLQDLGFAGGERLLVAGSTHPGEEEIMVKAFQSLMKEFPDLRLVIAPRHVERTNEIGKFIEGVGLKAVAFSQRQGLLMSQNSVLLIDTIGHLRSLYALASLVFMGKSLTVGGGQNIIEPAYFAKPILVGPHMENFRDVVNLFLEEKAIVELQDGDELLDKAAALLKDPAQMGKLGSLAKGVVAKNSGATLRTAEVILKLLQGL